MFCISVEVEPAAVSLDVTIIISVIAVTIYTQIALNINITEASWTISDKRLNDLEVIIGAGRGYIHSSKCLTLQ